MTQNEEAIWIYLIAHRSADAVEVANATGQTMELVLDCLARISSAEEVWRNPEQHTLPLESPVHFVVTDERGLVAYKGGYAVAELKPTQRQATRLIQCLAEYIQNNFT